MPTNSILSPQWRTHCTQQGPTAAKSSVCCGLAYSKMLAGIRDGHAYPVDVDDPDIRSVRSLLFVSGPSAIAGLIVSVGVVALDGESSRPIAHICDEIEKRISPALANRYSLASIVFIGCVGSVGASPNHGAPSLMARMNRRPFGVSNIPANQLLDTETSAADSLPKTKASSTARYLLPAITLAYPGSNGSSIRSSLDHEQISEAHSKHVDRFPCHGCHQ